MSRFGVVGEEDVVIIRGGVCGGEKQPSTCGICRFFASTKARLLAWVASLCVLARFRGGGADDGDGASKGSTCGDGKGSNCGDGEGSTCGDGSVSGDVAASATISAVTQASVVAGDVWEVPSLPILLTGSYCTL
jgi:hypothetical protein